MSYKILRIYFFQYGLFGSGVTDGRRNKWILGVRCLCLCIYIYTYVCIRYTLLHILYRFYTYFCSPAAGTILAVFIWLHWGFPYSEQLSTVAFSFHNTPENLQHFRKQLVQLLEYADSLLIISSFFVISLCDVVSLV